MSIIVPKCGFNRHTKRAILYGPVILGGANFRLLSVEQGIRQTQYFLKHWRQDSTAGKLLKCTLAWLQLSVGVSYSVLDDPHSLLPHMESKWIASLRSFLAQVKASIILDEPQVPEIQREHDAHIMDLVLRSEKFKPHEVRKINYCRLFLQAVTISDITTTSGNCLDPVKLTGSPSITSSLTRWHTINQDRPSESEWSLWRRANRIWSHGNGTLIQPLGRWILPIHKQRQQHFAYRHGGRLYIKTIDGQYQAFVALRGQDTTFRPRLTGTLYIRFSSIPVLAVPVEVSPLPDNELWSVQFPASTLIDRKSTRLNSSHVD